MTHTNTPMLVILLVPVYNSKAAANIYMTMARQVSSNITEINYKHFLPEVYYFTFYARDYSEYSQ